MAKALCVDRFCSKYSGHNIPNNGTHICCHYYDDFRYKNLEIPKAIYQINDKTVCSSRWVNENNKNGKNKEKKYCCKHRNDDEKFEIACLIFNYYLIMAEKLSQNDICYDDFRPGELVRENMNIKHYVCCKHEHTKFNVKSYLVQPKWYSRYNNQYFCINGVMTPQPYTELCCEHRTPVESQKMKENIQKYQIKIEDEKLQILCIYLVEYMLVNIPKVLIELILEY